jgi:hypothetical protein
MSLKSKGFDLGHFAVLFLFKRLRVWRVGGAPSASPAGGVNSRRKGVAAGAAVSDVRSERAQRGMRILTGRNPIPKFGKTQSFTERTSRRGELARNFGDMPVFKFISKWAY